MKGPWQQISDRKRWPKLLRKVNVSFRRLKRGEVLTFLLFVAIAIFFWTVQTAREESVRDYVITLEVTDQPQDMVFTTHVPKQLRVALTDTNTKLFNYIYNHRLQTVSVNFERYADAVGNFRISAAELQSLLSAQLMNTTRIVSVSPSLIDARFAQTEGRRYPVKVLADRYQPAENYRLHDIEIIPDSVTINAPSSVLDTMSYVIAIDSMHVGLQDTLRQQLTLDLPIGVKATPAKVHVVVPVVQYVEKVFDQIVVQVIDQPRNHRLVVFPYAVRVTCLVDFTSYREITSDMFSATVSYHDINEAESTNGHYLPIRIVYNGPQHVVTNVVAHPTRAEYVIE